MRASPLYVLLSAEGLALRKAVTMSTHAMA